MNLCLRIIKTKNIKSEEARVRAREDTSNDRDQEIRKGRVKRGRRTRKHDARRNARIRE